MAARNRQAPNQRQLRVGEEIRHALVQVLERGELRDSALADVSITVTEVRAAPDLKTAQVYIMPLGGGNVEGVVKALEKARSFLRRKVARSVHLKYVPDLHFRSDMSFDNARHIDDLLRQTKSSVGPPSPSKH